MDEEEARGIRFSCMSFAVESGSDCDSVLSYAAEYYDYIVFGKLPEADVLPFPSLVPKST